MSNFTPLSKEDQLTQKKKDKSKGFGQRKNKGNFGKTPSKPITPFYY